MRVSPRAWGAYPCEFCGKRISTNGLGHSSHMRKHVRNGEATETLREFRDTNGKPYWCYSWNAVKSSSVLEPSKNI